MFAGLFGFESCGAPSRACCGPPVDGRRPAGPADLALPLLAEGEAPPVPPRAKGGCGEGRRPVVPHVFTRFQFNVIYTQLGATQGALMSQQRNMLQGIVKHFVEELDHGVELTVMDSEGRSTDCLCRMDSKLTQLLLYMEGCTAPKAVALKEVERICSPEEVRNLEAARPLYVDECCATFVLTGKRFVTFRLDSASAREYWMLCCQVLRMSQDQPRQWYA
eukprot:TRINITY_DN73486_c0_g1_i1.p2 TRINITY_DN73486_c0_g1~~TRINITY_DN73486_c0_g1_i1.p2  ORF type:complete len:220 (+),score=38.64 TRINITY_DN73486_c0_g1_i1:101-760(+)